MPKWSPKINHIAHADDTILFGSGDRHSMIQMMKIWRDYETVSGQMINKDKSFFYLHEKTPLIVTIRLRIRPGNLSFTYLGCPIYYGRKKNSYFEGLIKKVAAEFSYGITDSCPLVENTF
ncbi:hypothetical protein H5410_033752 [Solanum commersonii]|uniref:Reverse transcriptase domain-containing protein n=1 Tax=Solanum commersonii TaxID=4109 RepID=A0A9J5YU05_SOLCO|nr:hypothetical protein H5410_033752 [Solanum commersonii]